jgi:anaerobic dimethyl sulfoxide reductase subunit B (iron-sulfur subunit)
MQIAFYFDQSRCTGCYTCSISCKDWHNISDPSVHWRSIIPLEKGSYPDVTLSYVSLSCNHCEEPACAKACPVNAITKREEDGVVTVDREGCLGNNACAMLCKKACPYSVPQFGVEEEAKMQMCNLCPDRLVENKKPICVTACPMRALDAGPIDVLKEKYGDLKEVEGFTYSKKTRPSIIFKPRYNLDSGY